MKPSQALAAHRDEVRQVCHKAGLDNLRIFGSIATGTDGESSDVDLLFDAGPEVSILAISEAQLELCSILGTSIDLVEAKAVPQRKRRLLEEAVPL